MSKTVVKFLTGWGRYNAGEIAGFEADVAAKLTGGKKPVAKVHGDGKAVIGQLDLKVSTHEIEKMIADAKAEIDQASAALDAREAKIAEREAELEERAQALDEHEADINAALTDVTITPGTDVAKGGEKGAPPAQGKASK